MFRKARLHPCFRSGSLEPRKLSIESKRRVSSMLRPGKSCGRRSHHGVMCIIEIRIAIVAISVSEDALIVHS